MTTQDQLVCEAVFRFCEDERATRLTTIPSFYELVKGYFGLVALLINVVQDGQELTGRNKTWDYCDGFAAGLEE